MNLLYCILFCIHVFFVSTNKKYEIFERNKPINLWLPSSLNFIKLRNQRVKPTWRILWLSASWSRHVWCHFHVYNSVQCFICIYILDSINSFWPYANKNVQLFACPKHNKIFFTILEVKNILKFSSLYFRLLSTAISFNHSNYVFFIFLVKKHTELED